MALDPISEVRQLIMNGETDQAIDIMLDQIPGNDPLHDEITVLKAQHKRWQDQMYAGVLSKEEESVTFNRINAALIDMLRKWEAAESEISPPTSEDVRRFLDEGAIDEAVRGLFGVSQDHPDEKIRYTAERILKDLEKLRNRQNSKQGLPGKEQQALESELQDRTRSLLNELDLDVEETQSFQSEIPEETLKTSDDFGETPVTEDESSEPPTPAPPTLLEVQTRMESDQWAKEDLLGYQTYAEVIANMILDELSQPPLAIGIIAPWGHGKTTLMHYVRLRLQEGKRPKQKDAEVSSDMDSLMAYSDQRMADSDDVRRWMKELDQLEEDQKIEYSIPQEGLPTIWFNPWQYQSSQQIWAGMAHALIQQLVARLSPKEREKFYFQLHLRRVDRNAIRQDIYRTTILSLLPAIAIVILSFALYAFLVAQPTNLPAWLVAGIPGGLSLAGLIQGGLSWWKSTRKGLADKYDQYFQQPDYENNLGMYHEVQEDLLRVFDLLVEDDKPAVIFIDDLDRCSPKKVAEVIEAINLLMNGSYRNKCYFVLGMDAQIVAAALDVAYKDMYGRLDNRARSAGSIGWYFLDKFIQLPFFIPTLDKEEKTLYLRRLFGYSEDTDRDTEDTPLPDEETIRKMVKEDVDRAKRGESSKMKRRRSKQEQTQMDRLFIEVVLEESKDSKDIVEQLQIYAPYLEDSPRGLKRFANLLRFYTAIQQLRIRDGLPNASTESLAKWLTISLRWPQFVRWLQWSQEEHQLTVEAGRDQKKTIRNLVHGLSPGEKANRLDRILESLPGNKQDPAEVEKLFEDQWIPAMDDFPQVPWLSDIELFDILYRKRTDESKLEQAVEVDIW